MISSTVNAFVSRTMVFRGTVIRTSANGLRETRCCSAAQPKTVRHVFLQIALTVTALRSDVISPRSHSLASSAVNSAALCVGKSSFNFRKTARHRFTVDTAGFVSVIQRSNSAQGVGVDDL